MMIKEQLVQKKMSIAEVIVVEGKDDTKRIQEVVIADTIETIGSAVSDETLDMIEHAEAVRGVIIFTDPDHAGEKIRRRITEHVPQAKHAFLTKSQATSSRRRASLGVEHASDEAIIGALKNVMTPQTEKESLLIPLSLLQEYGLLGGQGAKKRRARLGEKLVIGYTNGKQLRKRLAMFQVTVEELKKAMDDVLKEEKDGQ